jgi:hypothetical protein
MKVKPQCVEHSKTERTIECKECHETYGRCIACERWINLRTQRNNLRPCCEESVGLIKNKRQQHIFLTGAILYSANTS